MAETGGHAALMDSVYRGQRHIYDVTRKYFLLGRDGLIQALQPPAGGTVLEVGCGTGRNIVAAAKRYPGARFYGFDISREMLNSARRAIGRARLSSRAMIVRGDALDFDPSVFKVKAFDRVFCSYTLSMIPDWQGAIRHAASLVSPGGELHIVDFGDQAEMPGAFARVLDAWLNIFHVAPRLEMPGFCRELAEDLGWAIELETPHRGYTLRIAMRRPG